MAFMAVAPAHAQDAPADSDGDLAKKLSNPLSSLISVPFQFNYDDGYGTANGKKAFIKLQPVIPFKLNSNLTLVMRTIVPFVWQKNIAGLSGTQFGLGDTSQTFWFVPTPKSTSLGTLTWGIGPAFQYPTSTNALLGSGTFGAGGSFVFLFQSKGWTYGALLTQIWGVARTRSGTPSLNDFALQPFISYTTKTHVTFSVNTESNYNWTTKDWSVPINITIAKLVAIGTQRVQLQAGARYWADSSAGGPDGWGFRLTFTLLFPG